MFQMERGSLLLENTGSLLENSSDAFVFENVRKLQQAIWHILPYGHAYKFVWNTRQFPSGKQSCYSWNDVTYTRS